MLDHARAGDLPVLGDVADQHQRRAGFLGVANERLRRAAHLRHRAGRAVDGVAPHGLDGVDHDQPRCLALGDGGDDVLDRGFRREFDRRLREAEPFGAQPHLRDGFFAGDIDGAVAGARERGGGLNEQRRFADAGIARHQQHRAGDEAAAGDAIEFGDAGGEAWRVERLAGERFKLEAAAFARGARAAGNGRGRAFLDQRIPFAATLAAALPAAIGGAAVLADEAR